MTLRHFLLLCAPFNAVLLGGCSANKIPPAPSVPNRVTTAEKKQPTAPLPVEKIVPPTGIFFTTPYLQLGEDASDPGSLAVVWHLPTAEVPEPREWIVETRSPAGIGEWEGQTAPLRTNPVTVRGVKAHTVCAAPLSGLTVGKPFDYRLVINGKPVFAARANRSRPSADQDFRMVLFGDCAEGTQWQKRIAYQTSLLKPDAVLITGDIVYPHGRASEYRANYFPVYSSETADPKRGAPLLSSTLFIGVSGNHDLAYANLSKYPDALAYYYYWKQPLNGWGGALSGERPPVTGDRTAFSRAAGGSFPVAGNFSFD